MAKIYRMMRKGAERADFSIAVDEEDEYIREMDAKARDMTSTLVVNNEDELRDLEDAIARLKNSMRQKEHEEESKETEIAEIAKDIAKDNPEMSEDEINDRATEKFEEMLRYEREHPSFVGDE